MKRLVLLKKTCLVVVSLSLAACKGNIDLGPDPDLEQAGAVLEDQVEVSSQNEPIIDGVIEEEEWSEASSDTFEDGSQVFLLIKGEHLFLAIRAEGDGMIAGNVFLEQGGQVSVLHTSAALGTSLYEVEGGQYQKARDFNWCCRSRIDSGTSRNEREEFYALEGWLGINSFLGVENELEYKISLQDGPENLAVNFIYVDGEGDKHVWPKNLADGVAQPTAGGFPDFLDLSVEDWMSLEDLQ